MSAERLKTWLVRCDGCDKTCITYGDKHGPERLDGDWFEIDNRWEPPYHRVHYCSNGCAPVYHKKSREEV